MNKIIMITGNMGKWQIASNIFKKYDITLEQCKMDTPEIQALDEKEVSKYSALYAAKKLDMPVIKSDVGYYIDALGGFPGPFLKYVNEMLTSEDILKLMSGKDNREIKLKECLTYATPDGKVKQLESVEIATLAVQAMGEGSTFDRIVIFKGDELPKSMNSKEKNLKHFEKQLAIYDDMAKYLMEDE